MNLIKNLLRPGWRHSNESVRRAAVDRIEDDATLKLIALDCQRCHDDGTTRHPFHVEVAQLAIEKIRSQEVLEEIALLAINNYRSPDSTALGYEQDYIGTDDAPCTMAIARLENTDLLKQIAVESRAGGARQMALKRIADPDIAATLLMGDCNASVRSTAVEKVDDEAVLAGFVMKRAPDDSSVSIHPALLHALAKIADDDLLVKIVECKPGSVILRQALQQIANPTVLARIARETTSSEILELVKPRIEDPDTLAAIERKEREAQAALEREEREQEERLAVLTEYARDLVRVGLISAEQALNFGCASRFLLDAKEEARAIGNRIFRELGHEGMLGAHWIVRNDLGMTAARELESAWRGVGAWM